MATVLHPSIAGRAAQRDPNCNRTLRALLDHTAEQLRADNLAHLDEGTIIGENFHPKGDKKPVPIATLADGLDVPRRPGKGHFGNFIEAVRSRKVEDLNADVQEGHYSSALCHLANISYRLGSEAPFGKESKAFGGDEDARETFARMEEHLKGDGVKLEGLDYRLGRKLTVDAATA